MGRVVLLLAILSWPISPQQTIDLVQVANHFAESYAKWAGIMNTLPDNSVDYKEFLQWKEVKSKWRSLEKAMNKHHSGF